MPSTLVQQVRTIGPSSGVPIVQQSKQSNLDGSYAFGYQSADGSFRTETREVDGFVTGRYGYVDANGQLREFGSSIITLIFFYDFFFFIICLV